LVCQVPVVFNIYANTCSVSLIRWLISALISSFEHQFLKYRLESATDIFQN